MSFEIYKLRHLTRAALALLLALVLATAALGAPAAPAAPAAGPQTVSPERLAALLKEGAGVWVIDVRGGAAFEKRHIEGAMNIPLTLVSAKKFPKQKTVVLVDECLGLKNARAAAEILARNGVEKPLLLEGGLYGWQAAGFPVASRGAAGEISQVTPDELAWAQQNRVALKVYDLRDPADQEQYRAKEWIPLYGETIADRLKLLKVMLAPQKRQTLATKLEKPTPIVLVLPMASDVKPQVESSLFGFPGDLRYLDGGHAAWMAKPERKLSSDLTGPYCSDQKAKGEMK